jgi:hypothetical protein
MTIVPPGGLGMTLEEENIECSRGVDISILIGTEHEAVAMENT